MGLPFKALKYNEAYFADTSGDKHKQYYKENIPKHREEVAKANDIFHCECTPDYILLDECKK